MPFEWLYGTPLSGLSFALTTASGTLAKGYDTAQLSGVLSKNGGAWAAIGGRISGIPGNGVYTIAALSSVEMQCYTWSIQIQANSGCLEQTLIGYNRSGPVLYSDVSGFAHSLDCSGSDKILSAVSGLKTDVSGLPGILTAASGPVVLRGINHTSARISIVDAATYISNAPATSVDTSAVALQVWSWTGNTTSSRYITGGTGIDAPAATVDFSGIAGQVWNTVRTTATSSTTFGGFVNVSALAYVSGLGDILTAASGPVVLRGITHTNAVIPTVTQVNNVSGTVVVIQNNDKANYSVSGRVGIDTSSVNAIRDIGTTDVAVLSSGTLAHDIRLVRWFAWEDMVIDKTYVTDRQYHWDGTNMSAYFELTDDASTTKRTRP